MEEECLWRGMMKILMLSICLIFVPFCYAQEKTSRAEQDTQLQSKLFKLVEVPENGIYRLRNIIMRFFPPEGWKKLEWNRKNPDGISFVMSEEIGKPLLSIYILSVPSNLEQTRFVEQLKGILSYGVKLLSEEEISFLDVSAYSCITINKNIKHKHIIFTKANKIIQIDFAAKEEDFNNIFPSVERSLKTFSILETIEISKETIKNNDVVEIEKVIKNGADVNARYTDNMTVLMYAANYNSLEVARLLIEKGADVNAREEIGNSPLMFAASFSSLGVAKLLIDNGADVNAKNSGGVTALLIITKSPVRKDSVELVKLLLEKGADVNIKSNYGETAMSNVESCSHNNCQQIVKLLRQYGAR